MTFAQQELSTQDGRPVELLLVNSSSQIWRYTSSEVPVVYQGDTYEPTAMSRGEIAPAADTAKSSLNIKLPRNASVGDLFKGSAPPEVVTVTMYSTHYSDEDNDFTVIWKGRLINIEWDDTYLTLTTEGVFSSLQRVGLRRRCSALCTYTLYGTECGVNKANFRKDYVITEVAGLNVLVGAMAEADNHFAGGMIEYTKSNGITERRMIKTSAQGSGVLTLSTTPFGLSEGMTVLLYPGCDHLLSTCINKFGNSLNFGGQAFVPTKNPFNGTAIY